LSSEADTSCLPSFENETLLTGPECAFRLVEVPFLRSYSKVEFVSYTVGSQNLIVVSPDPEANNFPEGANSTEYTGALNGSKEFINELPCVQHIL
jgi:hypothetical protein